MKINKETMKQEAMSFLSTLFQLEEVKKVMIKEVEINVIDDEVNINKGLEECYHDDYSDIDFTVYLGLNPVDF